MRPLAVAVLALLAGGCAAGGGGAPSCTAPLRPAVQVDLYFGRDKPSGGEVSEAEWAAFLAESVTPRFPDGLSVLPVEGQTRVPSGPGAGPGAGSIGQHGVFRTERAVCAGA